MILLKSYDLFPIFSWNQDFLEKLPKFNQLSNLISWWICRGDTPFCSEECRAEQIEIDESKEKNKNLSASMKALRKKEQSETSPNKNSKKYPFHSGAVAAA